MKNTENMKNEELEDSLAVINSFLGKYDLSDMTLFTIFQSDISDSNHGLCSILSKYEGAIWRKDKIIKVRKEDADTLLKLQGKTKHILLDCYIEYLISCFSEYHRKSRFLNCVDEYLLRSKSLFIEGNENVISTTITLLVWLVLKFPNEKNRYHDRFLDIMMKECSKEILAEIVLSFTESKILSRLFTEDEYKQLFDMVYIDHVDSARKYYFYKALYQSFLENLILKKWKMEIKKRLVDFVLNNMAYPELMNRADELEEIRNFMDELKGYSDEEYFRIDAEIRKSGEYVISQMQSISISLPDDVAKKSEDYVKDMTAFYNTHSTDVCIEELLSQIHPFDFKDLDMSSKNADPLSPFIDECYYDENNIPILYDKNDSKAHSFLSLKPIIVCMSDWYCHAAFSPFVSTVKIDYAFVFCTPNIGPAVTI